MFSCFLFKLYIMQIILIESKLKMRIIVLCYMTFMTQKIKVQKLRNKVFASSRTSDGGSKRNYLSAYCQINKVTNK